MRHTSIAPALLMLAACTATIPSPAPPVPPTEPAATHAQSSAPATALRNVEPARAAPETPKPPAPEAPKAAPKPAPATPPAPKSPSPPAAPPKTMPSGPPAVARAAPLDLRSLEARLKETDSIGVLTKLSLKNQVDDLVGQFRAYHSGNRPPTLSELRPSFELLLMKVLSLLQDKDPSLAKDINSSRDAIWDVLSDRQKFAQYT